MIPHEDGLLHGWQSVPGGVKPTYLAQHGHEVINPKLPDEDFEEAVRIAQAEFDQHQPDVVPFSDSEELLSNSGVGFFRKGAGGVLTRFATVLAVHP